MEDAQKTAYLCLKKNDDIYHHLHDCTFKNLRTGVEWEVPEDKAAEIFVIDYKSTMMINKYPILEELIFKLKLKLES